jgi:hypothetical protein
MTKVVAETAVGVFSKKIAFTGFLSCGLPCLDACTLSTCERPAPGLRLLVPGTSRVMCSPAIPVGAGGLGHREIFFGGGNLTNSSPGRNRSGCSLGTPKCGLDTT